jgi:hypothetical protein
MITPKTIKHLKCFFCQFNIKINNLHNSKNKILLSYYFLTKKRLLNYDNNKLTYRFLSFSEICLLSIKSYVKQPN